MIMGAALAARAVGQGIPRFIPAKAPERSLAARETSPAELRLQL